MKGSRKFAIATALAILFGFVGAPIFAQTTAPGPYYATPSWDQTLPASTRFIVLSNMSSEAVLDRETGLVWERSPSTTQTDWFGALRHCISLKVGGRKGWRLPTIQELMSLVDPSVPNPGPVLPNGHPFTNVLTLIGGSGASYWSANTDVLGPTAAHAVGFFDGNEDPFSKTSSNFLVVWCVRGGQGVDPQ